MCLCVSYRLCRIYTKTTHRLVKLVDRCSVEKFDFLFSVRRSGFSEQSQFDSRKCRTKFASNIETRSAVDFKSIVARLAKPNRVKEKTISSKRETCFSSTRRSPPREIQVQKWKTPYGHQRICYIGDLSDDFLRVKISNSTRSQSSNNEVKFFLRSKRNSEFSSSVSQHKKPKFELNDAQ